MAAINNCPPAPAIATINVLVMYINITRAEENYKEMILQTNANGKPQYGEKVVNGIPQKVITVGGKSYIPNC